MKRGSKNTRVEYVSSGPHFRPCQRFSSSEARRTCGKHGLGGSTLLAGLRSLFKVFKLNNCVYVPCALFIFSRVFFILYWSIVD